MIVIPFLQTRLRWGALRVFPAIFLAAGLAVCGWSQGPNPSSAVNPFFGSVTVQPRTSAILKLSLDDAVRRGLENNLGLKQAESSEGVLRGQRNQALQQFLPTITLTGDTGFYQHNLAASGFGPSVVRKFAAMIPAGSTSTLSLITKDTLTQGQIHYSETLFSGPVIAGWKAAGAAERAAHFGKMTARGEVVQQVATAYLHAIAVSSEVDNAKALVAHGQVLLDHAHAAHEANGEPHALLLLEPPRERRLERRLGIRDLEAGEKPELAEVDPEHRTAVLGDQPSRAEDRIRPGS